VKQILTPRLVLSIVAVTTALTVGRWIGLPHERASAVATLALLGLAVFLHLLDQRRAQHTGHPAR
jgi:hypothetical protein